MTLLRYENSVSNPGYPFASVVTLAKLAAVTTNEQGDEIFDTSGVLDKLQKSLQLERLALYHNSNSNPWKINKRWEDLNPKEWIEIFEDGIRKTTSDSGMKSPWSEAQGCDNRQDVGEASFFDESAKLLALKRHYKKQVQGGTTKRENP